MVGFGWLLLFLSVPLIIVGRLATEAPYRYLGYLAIVLAIIGLAILKSQGVDPKEGLPAEFR